ncbi:MAG: hypothetical protein DSZ05_07480 [Sulfurospirillum sp.]|nr:MAG: hypothetical protein DSZ05_07480 [Sulfurospirillum sp.]
MPKISRRGFMKGAAALTLLPVISDAQEQKASNTIRFIHITDSHMDLQNDESVEAMKGAVAYINKHYPDLDFVLFGGDNFNNNVPGDKDAVAFTKIISELHCPAYSVRGNKESSPVPKGDAIGSVQFRKIFVEGRGLDVHGNNWALEKNGYLILGLDSCIDNANNGRYTPETIAYAQKRLAEGKPTIILNHHPYTNYWGGTEKKDLHKYVLNNTDEVQKKLFGAKNLILTLSGHKHIDNVSKIGHVTVIATRGFVRPLDLDQYPMRYVEIKDGKIDQKLIYTTS